MNSLTDTYTWNSSCQKVQLSFHEDGYTRTCQLLSLTCQWCVIVVSVTSVHLSAEVSQSGSVDHQEVGPSGAGGVCRVFSALLEEYIQPGEPWGPGGKIYSR